MRILSIIFLTIILTVYGFAQQKLTVGVSAPDFTAQSIDGKQFNICDLQGKIIVLTFWSTKCAICHSEIPKMNMVAERYKDKDVVFLAATMENQGKVELYLRKNPFTFSILPNSFAMVLKYADMDRGGNINMGFPSYFLIDKNGKIQLRSDGWNKTANLDSQISRLLTAE